MLHKKQNQPKSKLRETLNSAFFLWFLSAIVLGSASFLYTTWNDKRQKNLTVKETIRKLDLEISSRLSFFGEQIIAHVLLKDALLVLENPEKSDFPAGVFSEFSKRSIRALLWELQSLVPFEEREQINKTLRETKNFKKIYLATIQIPNFYDFLFQSGEKENDTSNKESKNTKKEPSELFEQNKTALSLKEEETKDDLVRMTKNGVVEIKPIHITIDVNLKVNRALDITLLTFEVFNLERWGKPFQDIFLQTDISTRSNFSETKAESETRVPLFNDKDKLKSKIDQPSPAGR